ALIRNCYAWRDITNAYTIYNSTLPESKKPRSYLQQRAAEWQLFADVVLIQAALFHQVYRIGVRSPEGPGQHCWLLGATALENVAPERGCCTLVEQPFFFESCKCV